MADLHIGGRALGAEAGAGSSSAKSTEAQGGDVEACRKARGLEAAGDERRALPAGGCSVPIQVELRPISSSTLVELTLVSFSIEPTDPSGVAWDQPGRTPDPIFAFSNGLGFDFQTPAIDDALTGAPSIAIGPLEMTPEGALVLLAFDDDEPFGKETIGSARVGLADLRSSPYVDVDLRSGGVVTGRVRLQGRVEILGVPVP
jgi:hypothetical protein